MKSRILCHPFIRWVTGLRICRWAAGHPVLSKFCCYEVISYLICGVLTTAVDYISYFVGRGFGMNTAGASTFAWLLAVVFAYIVNKIFVFFSTDWTMRGLFREIVPFVSCRILSFLMNLVMMVVTVDVLHWNEPLMKIVANVFVMIANYFASKLLVFRKKQ